MNIQQFWPMTHFLCLLLSLQKDKRRASMSKMLSHFPPHMKFSSLLKQTLIDPSRNRASMHCINSPTLNTRFINSPTLSTHFISNRTLCMLPISNPTLSMPYITFMSLI